MSRSVTITPEVRAVLANATVEGTAERPVVKLNAPQLDRVVYAAVDKVFKALGGKWNRPAGGHVFDRPVEGELAEALRSGVAVDAARTAEQFFTPSEIAHRVAMYAQLQSGHRVLEPSAGAGALIEAVAARHPSIVIDAVEQDDRLTAVLKKTWGLRASVFTGDFMLWEPGHRHLYDRVVMNPPFGRGKDIAHVSRAFSFLRPGGILVAIMSPHWTFGKEAAAAAFRDLVGQSDQSWEPLPANTFKSSGTGVQTGILKLVRPA